MSAAGHLSFEQLLEDWLHDSDAATREAVDEHLMRCDACGEALDALIALAEGVRGALRAGTVSAVASGAFVDHLVAQGLTLREYRLQPDDGVDCTVAPDDDLLVTRLAAALEGVERLDLVAQDSTAPGVQHELADVPFDARAGEVLVLHGIARIRQMPAHTAQVTLLAVEPGGRRELGRYTFHHRPWADAPPRP